MSTQTAKRLKIIPGRGLTGRDIKNRLRNRTIEGQVFGDEAYMVDENMAQFTRMSKIEQINAARQNTEEVRRLQRKLENAESKHKQKMQEQEIERKVQEKLKELGREQLKNDKS